MTYGKGATAGISGVAVLPNTGDNTVLFILAASLIAVGVAVMTASILVARKSQNSAK